MCSPVTLCPHPPQVPAEFAGLGLYTLILLLSSLGTDMLCLLEEEEGGGGGGMLCLLLLEAGGGGGMLSLGFLLSN